MEYITRLNDNPELPFIRYKVKGRGNPLKEAIEKTLFEHRGEIGVSNLKEMYIYFNRNDIKIGIVLSENGIKYGEKSEQWNDGIVQRVTEYIYMNI